MTEQQWIYEHEADGSARYALGVVGANPLVCFGINPSIAVPGAPDPTIRRLAGFASANGFDSWLMLNIYPQIATDPTDLHRMPDPALIAENERRIAQRIGSQPTLLAAWGGLVASRAYLPGLLRSILRVTDERGCDWVSFGEPTKHGHPRHPLYLPASSSLQAFDMQRYVTALR